MSTGPKNLETEIDLGLTGNIEVHNKETESFLTPASSSSFKNPFGFFSGLFPGANKSTSEASEWISNRRKGLKSWRAFVKTDKFKLPANVATAGRRLLINLEQFQSNYVCIFILLVLYCVLTSPLLLLALICSVGVTFTVKSKLANKSFKLGTLEFGASLPFIVAGIVSFPLFYLAGAGSAVFWVLGASMFFVSLHALFYASEPDPAADFQMEQV